MVALRIQEDADQTYLETYFGAVLEQHFRALRERIAGVIEREGALPMSFWLHERDALVKRLIPHYSEALRRGLEREMCRPRFPALEMLVNVNGRVCESALHMARDLAQNVTLAAAEYVDHHLIVEVDVPPLLDDLRHALRIGPLSDARAQRCAAHQTARALSAGALLAARALPQTDDLVSVNQPVRLCIY